ncbi:MAG: hypothetical protein HQL50_05705 [Magnetococcales bacterium]|nr:hypothetical protein [Magnetococcales bacterium]
MMISVVIFSLGLVPSLQALNSAMQSLEVLEESISNQRRARSRMEEILIQPYSALLSAATVAGDESTATSYSDAAGTENRRIVYLSLYDGDNADGDNDPFTGKDTGLLWVKVEIEGTAFMLETLTIP